MPQSSHLETSQVVYIYSFCCVKLLYHSTIYQRFIRRERLFAFGVERYNSPVDTPWEIVRTGTTWKILVLQHRKSFRSGQLNLLVRDFISSLYSRECENGSIWVLFETKAAESRGFQYRLWFMQRCWLQKPTILGRCCIYGWNSKQHLP